MLNAKSAKKRMAFALAVIVCLSVAGHALAQDRAVPAGKKPAVAAQPGAAKGKAPGEQTVKSPESLFDLILKGGWVMIPIGLCSVAALAIAIERGISLRRENVIPPDFFEGLKRAVGSSDDDVAAGTRYCDLRPCAVSNIFKAGISRMRMGMTAMEKAIEDAGAREVQKLKRSLRLLSVIATISPLLGLLGTVYGMISAFQAASMMGVGKGDALAVGIYEALVTTAAGLTLAIPVLIVYQIYCIRVDSLVDDIDDQAIELLEYTACNGKVAGPRQHKEARG
ncbi:MAG: MotA/TolQ/ExbB proton channel family protein [Planctomycetota bacterium]